MFYGIKHVQLNTFQTPNNVSKLTLTRVFLPEDINIFILIKP